MLSARGVVVLSAGGGSVLLVGGGAVLLAEGVAVLLAGGMIGNSLSFIGILSLFPDEFTLME